MKHVPQYLSAMTVFVDGVGLLGTAKQVALPKVEQMRETISAGGFERSLSTGVFKAMESEITLSETHTSVYKAASSSSKTPVFVVKGNLRQRGQDVPVIATIKGGVDVEDGSWETGKEVERKVKIYVDFYSLEIGGKEQCMLDVENMIARVQGRDLLEKVRNHVL